MDQLYATTQFRGRVTFLENFGEKEQALRVLIESLEDNPEQVMEKQLKPESIQKVRIGRIDIDYFSGKKADKVIIAQ